MPKNCSSGNRAAGAGGWRKAAGGSSAITLDGASVLARRVVVLVARFPGGLDAASGPLEVSATAATSVCWPVGTT